MNSHSDSVIGSDAKKAKRKSCRTIVRNNLIVFAWCSAIAVLLFPAIDLFSGAAVPVFILLYISCGFCLARKSDYPSYLSVLAAPLPLALVVLILFADTIAFDELILMLPFSVLMLSLIIFAPSSLILLGMFLRGQIKKLALFGIGDSADEYVEESSSNRVQVCEGEQQPKNPQEEYGEELFEMSSR